MLLLDDIKLSVAVHIYIKPVANYQYLLLSETSMNRT